MDKKAKTILPGALTYSLVSRFQKSLTPEVLSEFSSGSSQVLVDGRGISHSVDTGMIQEASKIGAKVLASTTTAHLKSRLKVLDNSIVYSSEPRKRGRPARNTSASSENKKLIRKVIKRRK